VRGLTIAFIASGLLLTGCATLAPAYHRPAPPIPATWPRGPSYAPDAPAPDGFTAAQLGWRKVFVGPDLRLLIEDALRNNRDLRVALLNVEQARAQYRVQRAALAPSVTANAAFTREHGALATSGVANQGSADAQTYGLTADISAYELDLFGRIRSLTRAALETYLSTEEASRAARISLISQVADSYLALAADCEQLRIANDTLTAQQAEYDLVRNRFEHAVASELDLRQAESSVAAARSNVAALTTQSAQDLNALNLVVGASVEESRLPKAFGRASFVTADLPAGVSASILLQRPDVRQAEHALRAGNADIGAARAAFFPTLTLTASGGSESLQLSSLFKGASGIWTFAPNLGLPIFDGGANRARLSASKIQRDIAVAQYDKAIQAAFREVADALARRGTIGAQLAADQANVAAAAASLTLTRARYEHGIDPFLNTLLAQRALYAAQQTLITTELARSQNRVALYRALGGGVEDN